MFKSRIGLGGKRTVLKLLTHLYVLTSPADCLGQTPEILSCIFFLSSFSWPSPPLLAWVRATKKFLISWRSGQHKEKPCFETLPLLWAWWLGTRGAEAGPWGEKAQRNQTVNLTDPGFSPLCNDRALNLGLRDLQRDGTKLRGVDKGDLVKWHHGSRGSRDKKASVLFDVWNFILVTGAKFACKCSILITEL